MEHKSTFEHELATVVTELTKQYADGKNDLATIIRMAYFYGYSYQHRGDVQP